MAARKTPPPRKPGTTPKKPAPRKTAAATKMGYEGKTAAAAAKSVTKQYGLVKNEQGQWVRPDMAFFMRQMEANGWGPNAQQGALNEAGTPVAVGGMRWMVGKNGAVYTGQKTGTPYRGPSAQGNGAGSGGIASANAPALGDGGLFTTGVSGATGAFIREKGGKGPAGDEAEGGTTKDNTKKRKAQTKKLVKRTTKKTNVKGKTIRKALRSPGVTKSDKKVYAKVAKQATPKLSSRLRQRDRRK